MSRKRTTSQVLEAAKAKISDPKKWTKGRMSDGRGAYCALGALNAVTNWQFTEASRQAWYELERAIPDRVLRRRVHTYNDSPRKTHRQVMQWFDRAIEAAKKREAKAS